MTPRHQRTTVGRRTLLVTLGGAVVAAPATAALASYALADTAGDSGGAATAAAGALPLTLVNDSGSFGNTNVHVYIVGNQDGRQVRVTPDGTLAPVSVSAHRPDGFTDYAIDLAAGGETRLNLPHMSGRI
jgi:hypothetical protein